MKETNLHRWLGTRCYGHLDFLDKAKDALAKVVVRELLSKPFMSAFLKPKRNGTWIVQKCGLYIYMCVNRYTYHMYV
jgi:hypothetical protein